jgi:pilus assembly protein Flp/PilA
MFGAVVPQGVRLAKQFIADERGATAIEYALIAAGIGATVATAVWSLGEELRDGLYAKIAAAL